MVRDSRRIGARDVGRPASLMRQRPVPERVWTPSLEGAAKRLACASSIGQRDKKLSRFWSPRPAAYPAASSAASRAEPRLPQIPIDTRRDGVA